MKLTLAQRVLRGPINFLVERFFPNSCFYGHFDPATAFAENDRGVVGYAAVMTLIRHARAANAEELKLTMKGCTLKGEPIGDWSVTVTEVTK